MEKRNVCNTSPPSVNSKWKPTPTIGSDIAALELEVYELQQSICALTGYTESWEMKEEDERERLKEAFMKKMKENEDEERLGYDDQRVPLIKLRGDLKKQMKKLAMKLGWSHALE